MMEEKVVGSCKPEPLFARTYLSGGAGSRAASRGPRPRHLRSTSYFYEVQEAENISGRDREPVFFKQE